MTENKYQNGKIYKIVDIGYNECYIGSTSEKLLSQRMSRHRACYKMWKAGKKSGNMTSFVLFEKYGVENCKIELIKEFPCDNKTQLEREEGRYIKGETCVNKTVAGRTTKEYKEEHKEAILEKEKERRTKNKEHIRLTQKTWYEQNKEQVKQRVRENTIKNKERVAEYQALYRENNKLKLQEQQRQNHILRKPRIKELREQNKDIIRAKEKEYREQNKEKINARRRKSYALKKEQSQKEEQGQT